MRTFELMLFFCSTMALGTVAPPVNSETVQCQSSGYPGEQYNSGATLTAQSEDQYAAVAEKLILLGAADQRARAAGFEGKKIDWEQADLVDHANLLELKKIIGTYGLLGLSKVGGKAVQGEFYVIQHSRDAKFQAVMLSAMKRLFDEHDFPGDYVALLEDRLLVEAGRAQLFGTQTKEDWSVYPIQDRTDLDKRRATHGLPPFSVQECLYSKFR